MQVLNSSTGKKSNLPGDSIIFFQFTKKKKVKNCQSIKISNKFEKIVLKTYQDGHIQDSLSQKRARNSQFSLRSWN